MRRRRRQAPAGCMVRFDAWRQAGAFTVAAPGHACLRTTQSKPALLAGWMMMLSAVWCLQQPQHRIISADDDFCRITDFQRCSNRPAAYRD